jgi:hypothetical protein
MKIILAALACLVTCMQAAGQSGSWKIKINGKTVLSAATEDETANTRKIKPGEWKKSGNLEIIFTESEPDMWYRSFLFYDKEDNEVLRKDSSSKTKVSLAELRRYFKGKKEIVIYTTIAPQDPNLAIRIRRVHLCTLKLP